MTSRNVDHPPSRSAPPARRPGASWVAALRIGALVAVVGGLFVVGETYGLPDAAELRAQVESAGRVGWLVFAGGYALLALTPTPKGAMTALGGLLFGWWLGAALSLAGALLGAVLAMEVGRRIGRDAVDRLAGGRLERVDTLLREHGLGAVVALRLVPVLPYTVINYAAGLTGVSRRDYVLGSAIGMIPGSLAYAALGAWGAEPWGLFAGLAGLVVLVMVGGVLGRRLLAPAGERPPDPEDTSTPDRPARDR